MSCTQVTKRYAVCLFDHDSFSVDVLISYRPAVYITIEGLENHIKAVKEARGWYPQSSQWNDQIHLV